MGSMTSSDSEIEELIPSSPIMGTLSEKCENVLEVEWKIENFMSVDFEADRSYKSAAFYFNGTGYSLQIRSGSEAVADDIGWIALYLCQEERHWAKTRIQYFLGIKKANGMVEKLHYGNLEDFYSDEGLYGIPRFLKRDELQLKLEELVSSGTLTITCTLSYSTMKENRMKRLSVLENASHSWKKICLDRRGTDVVLKVGQREFPAHKMVLENRSSVFAAMFNHDMVEKRTNMVQVDGINADVFELFLTYIYSSQLEGLSRSNVFQLYAAADKYDMHELKESCVEFMENDMCFESICDILSLISKYEEETLEHNAIKFVYENSGELFQTDTWEAFKSKNHALALQVLESVLINRRGL